MNRHTTKRVEQVAARAEQEIGRAKRQARRAFTGRIIISGILLGGILAGALLYQGVFTVQNWFQAHRIKKQAPIVLQWPLIVEGIEVSTPSAKTQGTAIVGANLPIINELYRKVRFLESNAGMNKSNPDDLHNYCQRIGKVNEIGWIPVRGEKYCFEDEGVQWSVFRNVFEARLNVMSIREALCVHNLGKKIPDCAYALSVTTIK